LASGRAGGRQRFPLAEARQAHELLGKGGVIGKIVLLATM
jgi:NADPH:quinone reductase-like Zn-dependent oxidoreductase